MRDGCSVCRRVLSLTSVSVIQHGGRDGACCALPSVKLPVATFPRCAMYFMMLPVLLCLEVVKL